MAITCKVRRTRKKKVLWKRFETEPFENDRFQVKALSMKLIHPAASLFRKAYPEVYGSPHEFVLMAEQYEGLIALEKEKTDDAFSAKALRYLSDGIDEALIEDMLKRDIRQTVSRHTVGRNVFKGMGCYA